MPVFSVRGPVALPSDVHLVPGDIGWTGPTTNLVAAWPMNAANVSGATVTEVIAANNGTISGTVGAAAGPSGHAGYARSFDGSTGYISLASDPISIGTAFSIGLWANIANVTAAGSGTFAPRFINIQSGGGGNQFVVFSDHAVGGQGSYSDNTAFLGGSSAPFVNNTWGHLVVTFDGGTTLKTYFNGSLNTAGTTAGVGTQALNLFGARTTTTGQWVGSMAVVVMYNVELSAGQVTALYNAQ